MNSTVLIGIVLGGVILLGILVVLALLLKGQPGQPGPAKKKKKKRACPGCARITDPSWDRCLFCGHGLAPPGVSVPKLEFLCGPLAGQIISLSEEITTIGSVAGNTVVLSDPAVSRKHVGIRRVGSGYEFADLGSTNGVYINGNRVPKKTLSPGDVLRVGNTEVVFRAD